ncbi:hypothetical protein [Dactylosporangium sp. NPDC050588]|uniref:hypothetical protein n=1 Tax=Dactylosporangium sp. NPDC050588 TaxID=3157211 RepID=UPI0034074649
MTLPRLQDSLDLMCATAAPDATAVAAVDAWSRRTGLELPAAVREFYTTDVSLELSDGGTWTLPFTGLWREFSGDATLWTLDEVLAGMGEEKVCFEADVMRIHHVYFQPAGNDPVLHHHTRGEGWSVEEEPFSGWLFDWFVSFHNDSGSPASFWGPDADHDASEERQPVLPFGNELWLRARDLPVPDAVGQELTRRHGEPTSAGATRYWGMPDGLIQITGDAGGSAWWLHGDDPAALQRIVESVWSFGDLARTLRSSTMCHDETARKLLATMRAQRCD